MEKVDKRRGRRLYGNIIYSAKNLDDVIGSFPLCICRGRCVCSVTPEKQKVYIEEVRRELYEREYNQRENAYTA